MRMEELDALEPNATRYAVTRYHHCCDPMTSRDKLNSSSHLFCIHLYMSVVL